RFVTLSPGPTLEYLEPRVGVEPTTCRLRIGCSTTELPRPDSCKSFYHKLMRLLSSLAFSCPLQGCCYFLFQLRTQHVHCIDLRFCDALDVDVDREAYVAVTEHVFGVIRR